MKATNNVHFNLISC